MVPLKEFTLKSRVCKEVSAAISGIVPVNKLLINCQSVKFFKVLIVDGIVPDNRLFEANRLVNDFISEMLLEIVPTRRLLDKSK